MTPWNPKGPGLPGGPGGPGGALSVGILTESPGAPLTPRKYILITTSTSTTFFKKIYLFCFEL